ncbi:MAG: PD40 domain-containing protein [Acidobacteria bacterium]|nr:PD40 domain-containing protein [Acidobacteriota bacterium]MCB9397081.1 PD40 domain-containing protein [Acidobacteriota bacterium]
MLSFAFFLLLVADWQPDQAALIFTATVQGKNHLFLRSASGEVTNLTPESGKENWAHPHPNGQSILFQSQRDGSYDLFQMSLSDRHWIPLATHTRHDGLAIWHPNGTQIAFFSARDFEYPPQGPIPGHVYLLTNGENPKQITQTRLESTLGPSSWSPDGKSLLISRSSGNHLELFQLNIANGQEKLVSASEISKSSGLYAHQQPYIAFSSEQDTGAEVWVMDTQGQNARVLAKGEGHYYPYAWSPNDEWVSMTWYPSDWNHAELQCVHVATGKIVVLIQENNAREGNWLAQP